jgi:YegS/Rv2252/BmrU family lipid kinase
MFIVNPYSGIKNWEKVSEYVKSSWGGSGHYYELQTIWKWGEGEKYAQQAVRNGFDIVAAVGGDGTINEIARGLINTETALAVIPGGSGNGFARHFKIPLSRKVAIKVLLNPEFHYMDVGEINGRIFVVTSGVGMDARISHLINATPRRGLWSYYVATILGLLGYRPPIMKIKMEASEMEVEPILITASNLSQYGGGVRIAPNASPFDGYLDLCILKQMSPFLVVYHFPKLFTGRIKRVPATTIIRFKEVSIITKFSQPVHIDGDPIQPTNELNIKVRPGALKIALGKNE